MSPEYGRDAGLPIPASSAWKRTDKAEVTRELRLEGAGPGRSPLCVRTVLSSMENHGIHGHVRSEEVPLGSCLLRLPYRENLHGWTVRLMLVRSPLWWATSVYLPDIQRSTLL